MAGICWQYLHYREQKTKQEIQLKNVFLKVNDKNKKEG